MATNKRPTDPADIASINGASVPPAPPAPPTGGNDGDSAPFDPEFLSALLAAEWRPGGGSAAGPARIAWSDDLVTAAERIGFCLDCPPRSGSLPWRVAAAPKDLTALNRTIPATPDKQRVETMLISDIINGRYMAGLPVMANGDGLPLVYLLTIFAAPSVRPTFNKVKSWKQLKVSTGTTCLVSHIATVAGRYCYLDGETLRLSDSLTDPK